MKREIHIWDLPTEKVYIQFKDKFRENFFNKAYNKFNNWRVLGEFLDVPRGDTTIARNWKNGMNCYPLDIIFKIGELINVKKEEIEKNIIQIRCKTKLDKRGGNSGKPINNPKLPIKIDENFIEILGHICGDGSIPTKYSKKGIKLLYVNSEPKLIVSFQTLVKEVFGNIKPTIYIRKGIEYGNKYNRPNYSMQYPTILSLFILSVFDYKVKEDMNIPDFINKTSLKEKGSFLRALFDDEATLKMDKRGRKSITISLKPKKPLEDIHKLINNIGINTSKIYYYDYTNSRFSISGKKNLLLFKKLIGFKHPEKNKKLDSIIKNGWKYEKYNEKLKKNILNYLINKKKRISTYELSKHLNKTPTTTLKYLHRLEKNNLISNERIINRDKEKNINIIHKEWFLNGLEKERY